MVDLEAGHGNMVMDHSAKAKVMAKVYKLFEASGNLLTVEKF